MAFKFKFLLIAFILSFQASTDAWAETVPEVIS